MSQAELPRRRSLRRRAWVLAGGLAAAIVIVCLLVGGGDEEFIYQGRSYRDYLRPLTLPGADSAYLEAKRAVLEAGAQGLPTLRQIIHRGEPAHVHYFLRWQTNLPPRLRAWLHQRIRPYDHQQELQGALSAAALLGKEAAPLAGELGRQFAQRNGRQTEVAHVMARLGPAAVEPVLPYLTDPDLRTRSLAAFVIHELGPQATNAAGRLLEGLRGADANHRLLVAQTLGRMGSSVLPQVTALLASTNADARLVGVQALRQLHPLAREVTPELTGLLDDSTPEVRFETASLLATWWNRPTADWRQRLQQLPADHPSRERYARSLDALEAGEARLLDVLREELVAPDPKKRLVAATRLVEFNGANAEVLSVLQALRTSRDLAPWEMAGLSNLLQRAQRQVTDAPVRGAEEIPPRPGTAPGGQSPP